MKNFVAYLLKNRMLLPAEDWTVQGLGFMRLRVSSTCRLHIWDSRLQVAEASDIHDHAQWAFTSQIVSGALWNQKFEIKIELGELYHMSTLNAGIGGGLVEGTESMVRLSPCSIERYLPGDSYRQEPKEIHRTRTTEGTITVIHQERTGTGTARVFWPADAKWGNAIPRQATREEINSVGYFALSILETSIGVGIKFYDPTGPICGRCYDETPELFPANCAEKPELLLGAPIGQYHCPGCGAMVMAGIPHPPLCKRCIDRKHRGFDAVR